MYSVLCFARECLDFVICPSLSEAASILFLVDCCGLTFTKFFLCTRMYRHQPVQTLTLVKNSISDKYPTSLPAVQYLHKRDSKPVDDTVHFNFSLTLIFNLCFYVHFQSPFTFYFYLMLGLLIDVPKDLSLPWQDTAGFEHKAPFHHLH